MMAPLVISGLSHLRPVGLCRNETETKDRSKIAWPRPETFGMAAMHPAHGRIS